MKHYPPPTGYVEDHQGISSDGGSPATGSVNRGSSRSGSETGESGGSADRKFQLSTGKGKYKSVSNNRSGPNMELRQKLSRNRDNYQGLPTHDENMSMEEV